MNRRTLVFSAALGTLPLSVRADGPPPILSRYLEMLNTRDWSFITEIVEEWDKPLPGHFGFRQRAAFHEVAGERDQAMQLMLRAHAEGLSGFEDGVKYLENVRREAITRDARRRAKEIGVRTKACPGCQQRYVPGDQFCGECGFSL